MAWSMPGRSGGCWGWAEVCLEGLGWTGGAGEELGVPEGAGGCWEWTGKCWQWTGDVLGKNREVLGIDRLGHVRKGWEMLGMEELGGPGDGLGCTWRDWGCWNGLGMLGRNRRVPGMGRGVPGGAGGCQEELGDFLDGGKMPGWNRESVCWSQTRFPALVTSKLVPLDAVNGSPWGWEAKAGGSGETRGPTAVLKGLLFGARYGEGEASTKVKRRGSGRCSGLSPLTVLCQNPRRGAAIPPLEKAVG